MAVLKSKHKELIVRSLATCVDATEVQEKLRTEFEIDATIQQIVYYNADKSPQLAKKWRHMFHDTRSKYINDVASIPIANKGYRLNEMQKLYEKAKSSKNIVLAMDILEQAAKEVGGMYEEMKDAGAGQEQVRPTYQQINNYYRNKMQNE